MVRVLQTGHTVWHVDAIAASAKLNLALHVVGQRDDRYHLIDSVVVRANFGDRIQIEKADVDSFEIFGPFAHELADFNPAENLIIKARNGLRAMISKAYPVAIKLEKNLPVASGVGGGSADAAAALDGLSREWNVRLQPDALAALALSLGADVPMCLNNYPMHVRGIGDEITPIPKLPALPVVAVNPGVSVSTPTIFKALTVKENPPLDMPDEGWTDGLAFIDWLDDNSRNDLYPPALKHCPQIGQALQALRASGARLARMSGSGATCFGLYATEQQAQLAADSIQRDKPLWFVQAGQTLPSMPTGYKDYPAWAISMTPETSSR